MSARTLHGIRNGPVLALLLLLQANAASAVLCRLTDVNSTKRLPRSWREAARRLHGLLRCDVEPESKVQLVPSDDHLGALLHPALYFQATFQREQQEKLGFDVSRKDDHLEVDKVHEKGLLAEWNSENPSRAVQAQDRVVSVNGVHGNGTLLAGELRGAGQLVLRLLRLDPRDQRLLESRRLERTASKVLREAGPPGLGVGIPEPRGSPVAVLHTGNLERFVKLHPVTLVFFYASWCGHCKELTPDFRKAAELVAQMELPMAVRFAKFDDGDQANRDLEAGSRFNFSSYPHLHLFRSDGRDEPFFGQGAEEIAAHVEAVIRGQDPETAIRRALFKTRPMLYKSDTDPNRVMDLEPEHFDEAVLAESKENNRVWIVEFYSDKCPFCKSLKPEIVKASDAVAKKFGSKVKFGAVNSRVFPDLAERFGVTSYPWIISVYAGVKGDDMAGLGGAETVIDWAASEKKRLWKREPKWKESPPWPASSMIQGSGGNKTAGFNETGSWRELLGRRTWFLLHTLAAKYPDEPTEADQVVAMKSFVAALGQHYACPVCRKHLRAKLAGPELGPVQTQSRTELALWFCRLHNMVNKDLGKPEHECNAFLLDMQYLKSCGECSATKVADDEGGPSEKEPEWDFWKYSGASRPRSGRAGGDHSEL